MHKPTPIVTSPTKTQNQNISNFSKSELVDFPHLYRVEQLYSPIALLVTVVEIDARPVVYG